MLRDRDCSICRAVDLPKLLGLGQPTLPYNWFLSTFPLLIKNVKMIPTPVKKETLLKFAVTR